MLLYFFLLIKSKENIIDLQEGLGLRNAFISGVNQVAEDEYMNMLSAFMCGSQRGLNILGGESLDFDFLPKS